MFNTATVALDLAPASRIHAAFSCIARNLIHIKKSGPDLNA